MGCCSVTQRHTGVDDVGPDEIELLELSGDNLGVWSLGETRLQLSVRISRDEQQQQQQRQQRLSLPPPTPPPPARRPSTRHLQQEPLLWGRSRDELHHRIFSQQLIKDWEGQPPHMYGEIIYSSLVSLYDSYTQGMHEHFLVLFSSHLLILSLDHSQQDFIYKGILPLSGISLQSVSLEPDGSHSPHMFEISSPMMDSKVFICPSAAELQKWTQQIEDRKYKSMAKPMSPSHCTLSCLLPCDENWKKEELKRYLLQAPIRQWEGSPIQHMGHPGCVSMVHIINTKRQGLQERLMVLFPQDVLLLSVDSNRMNIRYEGRLSRRSISAVERAALSGRMEFELIGELTEPLLISCSCQEDYWNWVFQLQQPDRNGHAAASHSAPPLVPKLQKSRKESQEAMMTPDQCHINGQLTHQETHEETLSL